MRTKAFFLGMALLALMVTSCQKTKPLETSSVEAADDAVFTEAVFDDVFTTLEVASYMTEDMKKSATVIDTCPVITVTHPEETAWPVNIEINYGTSCEGLFDVVRSGKILITCTGPRKTVSSERTVTFQDYYINGVKIQGTFTVKNEGLNNSGNVEFSASLTGGKITLPDNRTIEREFSREREYIAGYATWNPWDDVCLISGSANGKTLSDLTYSMTIINPLRWEASCRFLVSGTIEFDVDGVEPFSLDYGDGDCDNEATLSRGDDTKTILLRYNHPKLPIGK